MAIRKRKAMNMAQFARLLGVSFSSISRYESGKVIPSRPVLQHLLIMAEGVEKVTVSRAIGESLVDLEQREIKSNRPTSSVESVLVGDVPITEKEREWLECALVVLRSSKGSLLEGILGSLHEGALIDDVAKKRKGPKG